MKIMIWVSGNLYLLDNIYALKEKIVSEQKEEKLIITGDGGFDVSNDHNNQEQLSFLAQKEKERLLLQRRNCFCYLR